MSTTPPPNSKSNSNFAVSRSQLTTVIDDGPAHLRPIFMAVRDAGLAFCIVPQGGQSFDPPTNHPTIVLIVDDMNEAKGPQDFHQESLRNFVKRCTPAMLVTCEPPPAAYAAAAALSVLLKHDIIIIETRPEHEANWKAALDAINPDLAWLMCLVEPTGGVH